MPKTRSFAGFLISVAALVCCSSPTDDSLAPDLIIHGGKIFTANESSDYVEAVAVRNGWIVAVGPSSRIHALTSESTSVMDLEGRTMLPGFNDNHVHLGRTFGGFQEWEGGLISAVPEWLRSASTIEQLIEAIRVKASETPKNQWIRGALSREIWPNQTLPTRHDLDKGTTDHPVLLTRGPHTTVLNSTALASAGITHRTSSPGGGEVQKDERGEPTGRLFDAARRLVNTVAPADARRSVGDEIAIENMRSRLIAYASTGVSSLNIAGMRPPDLRLLQTLYDRHGEQLPRATVQLRLSPGFDTHDDLKEGVKAAIEELEGIGFVTGFGDDRLKIGAIKMSIDGGLSAPAYWSLEPYENRPDFTGVVRIPAEAFYPVARRAHELGWQVGTHAMGDGAVEMVVDQLEKILDEIPRENHRHYVHHVAVKPPRETIEKMVRLGIGVASQPSFTVGLGAYAVESLAGDRESSMNPTRSLLDSGVWVSWGSDGAPYGPRVTLWTGITRKGWDGSVYGPEEAVSREQAIRLHTREPAYQSFDEDRKGTIEVGRLADFVVLEEDIFTMDADRIRSVPIAKTIVGGREVYSRRDSKVTRH